METTYDIQSMEMEKSKRPTFLTVLCVLSFIWEGLVLAVMIVALCMSGYIVEMLRNLTESEQYEKMDEMQKQGINQILEMGEGKLAMYLGLFIVLCLVSLLSVIAMWRLKKWGFYLYAGLGVLSIVSDVMRGSYLSVFITVLFVVLYGLNLKHMGSGKKADASPAGDLPG